MSTNEPIDLLAQRRVCHDFRWASRTWTSMPYFVRGEPRSPKEIIQAVIESQTVIKVIKQLAKEKSVKEEDILREAKDTLIELAHDYHLYAIRWFAVVLSKLGKRLYNSIQVNVEKLEQIKRAYGSYPVLLLPTHRSYVDFLLVSYLSFCFDLTLPIIAAGMDFKGMVGVGEILRKSGAFYIRRRFGGDPLYWALISEYVKTAMLEGGHPLEMFVEGTRSRTGKSLKPKIGLMSIILELVTSGQIPNILILPISMSYDRTLEEQLYAHELLGQPKPKESTNGLMKALKWLGSQSYGSVYVNFGNLISVREMLEKRSSAVPSIRPEIYLKSVQEIALQVVLDHQANLVIPLVAGISLIILSEISRTSISLPLSSLIRSMEFLQTVLHTRKLRFGYPLLRESLETNVRYILGVHGSLLRLHNEENGDFVEANLTEHGNERVQCMVFQHYANQILSPIFPLSLIAILQDPGQVTLREVNMEPETEIQLPISDLKLDNLSNESEVQQEYTKQPQQIGEDYEFLRELFQEDFLYADGSISAELNWASEVYNSLKISFEEHAWLDFAGAGEVFEHPHPRLLRRAIEPYFIAYWGVGRKLKENIRLQGITTCLEIKDFAKACQDCLSGLMNSGDIIKVYGALSLETISNAISSFVRASVLDKIKMENGSFGIVIRDACRLDSIFERLGRLVGGEWRTGNMEKHSARRNSERNAAATSDQLQLLRSKL